MPCPVAHRAHSRQVRCRPGALIVTISRTSEEKSHGILRCSETRSAPRLPCRRGRRRPEADSSGLGTGGRGAIRARRPGTAAIGRVRRWRGIGLRSVSVGEAAPKSPRRASRLPAPLARADRRRPGARARRRSGSPTASARNSSSWSAVPSRTAWSPRRSITRSTSPAS